MKKLLIIASLFVFSATPVLAGEWCEPEPVVILGCTRTTATNYNPLATQDDGTCYNVGGFVMPPNINANVVVSGGVGGVTLSFLTSAFMTCGLLVDSQSNQFALGSFSLPTSNGWDIYGSISNNFGYNRLVSMETQNATYHQVGVALAPGNYFIRPYCLSNGVPLLGIEKNVSVK